MPKRQLPKGSIGHVEDMKESELKNKHIDGETGFVFKTDDDYIAYKKSQKKK